MGKNWACNLACLAVKVERATGSWAQAWKISAAYEVLLAGVGVWGKWVREERGIRRDRGGLAIGP